MKLRLTGRAAAQLGKVLGDIASRSPQGSAGVSARVSDVLKLLLQFPFARRRPPAAGRRGAVFGAS